MWHVYILQSKRDNLFYVGYTSDIESRLAQHNDGLSEYTSRKRLWDLVYSEELETKTEAIKRELFLKKQKNKSFYERLIENKQ